MIYSRPVRWAYDVQQFTGRSVAANPRGTWFRGQLYRAAMPAMQFPPPVLMHDPSRPETWNHPSH